MPRILDDALASIRPKAAGSPRVKCGPILTSPTYPNHRHAPPVRSTIPSTNWMMF
jgi:hypothetical protein